MKSQLKSVLKQHTSTVLANRREGATNKPTTEATKVLREMAYVLELTRRVREQIVDDARIEAVAL